MENPGLHLASMLYSIIDW